MPATQVEHNLEDYSSEIESAVAAIDEKNTIERIWDHDHTVWQSEPTEISNRLGWLQGPEEMLARLKEIDSFVAEVKAAGFTHALLLGMGGSSLAPEVFRFTFGVQDGCLDLAVLDSTDPGAVLEHANRLDPQKTLFIVSTKSGGTVETFSFFKYFYNSLCDRVGANSAGAHFVAITDPGSALEKLAAKRSFRRTFLNNPNIGGRFSVLSFFGLVPAALVGVDIKKLLERARQTATVCRSGNLAENEGARLGVLLGELALNGRDKVTLVASPAIRHFGAWAEQLVAESTGKKGKGILPVDLEELGPPDLYSHDRVFVSLKLKDDEILQARLAEIRNAGFPLIEITLDDAYDLGKEFFRWEIATAVACERLGINPFDQPNVESAKILARQMVAEYQEKGSLPSDQPTLMTEAFDVFSSAAISSAKDALWEFLTTAAQVTVPRNYVAIQAYVQPSAAVDDALQTLRGQIRERTKLAVTVGYGPRFLHSTGQLHKGDAGNGIFIQITANSPTDAPIPDEPGQPQSAMSFGVLKDAQALGDRRALLESGRKVIRFHIRTPVEEGISKLAPA